jgi:hypothetical protein
MAILGYLLTSRVPAAYLTAAEASSSRPHKPLAAVLALNETKNRLRDRPARAENIQTLGWARCLKVTRQWRWNAVQGYEVVA